MNLNIELNGSGDLVIVIETAMGSTCAEWRPIIKPLLEKYTVLSYDRAGYGKSEESNEPRNPQTIAKQLNDLIKKSIPNKKYLLVGHSIGSLYVQQYIRDYPENVIGAIFLDPLTTEDYLFKTQLTKREFTKAGFNKWPMIKTGLFFGKLRLLKLFKPLLRKSIPFYYYKNYDKETEKDILSHMTQLRTYKTSKREYEIYDKQFEIKKQLQVNTFPPIPVRVLHHNSQIMIDEMMNFGGLNSIECEKADALWLDVINKHYAQISPDYRFEVAGNSGHYIHLTDPDKLYEKINEITTKSYSVQAIKSNMEDVFYLVKTCY